jgi:hypothetical protein
VSKDNNPLVRSGVRPAQLRGLEALRTFFIFRVGRLRAILIPNQTGTSRSEYIASLGAHVACSNPEVACSKLLLGQPAE